MVPTLPALAVNQLTLMIGLLIFGATAGILDIAMNVQGVAVEARMRRPVMSSFHGMYSAGGIAGSIIGGGLAGSEAAWQIASRGIPVTLHEMRPARATGVHQTDGLAELAGRRAWIHFADASISDDTEARLAAAIRSASALPPREIIAELYDAVLAFSAGTPQKNTSTPRPASALRT